MKIFSNEIKNTDQNTFLDIKIGSVIKNYKKIKNKVSKNCNVAATVKADAYGLGIKPIAKSLIANKCMTFFVATLTEGIKIREINKKIYIYVLNGLNDNKEVLFRDLKPCQKKQNPKSEFFFHLVGSFPQ